MAKGHGVKPVGKGLKGNIGEDIQDINKDVKKIEGSIEDDKIEDTVNGLINLQSKAQNLLDKIPGAPTSMEIKDFFETVGAGVIEAQKNLDEESFEYLQSKKNTALPSIFRIPKASAEIKFGIESTTEKKFNVIVYGSGNKREQSQQHKVAFDITSTPPPPDVMANLDQFVMKANKAFITNSSIRERLQKMLQNYADSITGGAKKKEFFENLAKPETFKKVLILRGEEFWLLLNPKEEGGVRKIDQVKINFNENEMHIPENGVILVKNVTEKQKNLFDIFLEYSKDQEAKLKIVPSNP